MSWEGVIEIVMVVIMAIAFSPATPWLRRNRVNLPKPLDKLIGFNVVWSSHRLFVIIYTLLIIHSMKLYLTHEWYKKTVIPLLKFSFFLGELFIL